MTPPEPSLVASTYLIAEAKANAKRRTMEH